MRRIILVFACIVFTCHSTDKVPSTSFASDSGLHSNEQLTRLQLRPFVALLLALEPKATFRPTGSLARNALHRRGDLLSGIPLIRMVDQLKESSQPKSIELTYFDIKAMPGEKVRLALALTETPFKDNRLKFTDWAELKPKTKYGQLPILNIDGQETYQSGAMLRWAGTLGDGSLYPVQDIEKMRKIEEMLGLSDDLQRAWSPALYLGMAHTTFGHPEDWPEKPEVVKRMREAFLEKQLPKFMGYLSAELERTGAFLTGDKPSIADCQILPQVNVLTTGVVDHIPKDCLEEFPAVTAWIDRMMALPEIKQFYEQLAASKADK